MRKILSLLYLFTLFACKNETENKFDKSHFQNKRSVNEDIKDTYLLDSLVDVQYIKKQAARNVTTSFLDKKEVTIYPDKIKNNFYGSYILIPDRIEPSGCLIIYDSVNPYIYEKTTDEFTEITLTGKGIKLYKGKVEIGMPSKELIHLMGNNYKRLNDSVILYEKADKKAFFKIKDNILNELRIGIYRKGITIDTILAHSIWAKSKLR